MKKKQLINELTNSVEVLQRENTRIGQLLNQRESVFESTHRELAEIRRSMDQPFEVQIRLRMSQDEAFAWVDGSRNLLDGVGPIGSLEKLRLQGALQLRLQGVTPYQTIRRVDR
jgi:hypothetical protein